MFGSCLGAPPCLSQSRLRETFVHAGHCTAQAAAGRGALSYCAEGCVWRCESPPSVDDSSSAGAGRQLCVTAQRMTRKDRTQKRHKTIRGKVEGRPERPRLAVYRSNNHIYAQVIDDSAGNTLVAASTLTSEIREELKGVGGANKAAAQLVGKRIAELCLASNIDKVSFDRGGNIYHGRVQALAEAARESGLSF